MKTLTQVILPIAAIVGLVFGVTYIINNVDTSKTKPADVTPNPQEKQPLKFVRTAASRNPEVWYLRDWKSDYEFSEPGHFDFWFQNVHPESVKVNAKPSCTCAGIDLIAIPPEAWGRHLKRSAAAGWPGLPSPYSLTMAALNTIEFSDTIHANMQNLATKSDTHEGTVPPASPQTGPQIGIVRLSFVTKNEPGVNAELSAAIIAKLPEATANNTKLNLTFNVMAPYELLGGNEVRLGDLAPNSMIERELYYVSKTRKELKLVLSTSELGEQKDCVQLSEPEQLKDDELQKFIAKISPKDGPPIDVKSAYRVRLRVYERREVEENGRKVLKQLDLGPIAFQLRAATQDPKDVLAQVVGSVHGDVQVMTDQVIDRIDFGPSYPSKEARSKRVTVVSERPGIELELLRSECRPESLNVSLTPSNSDGGTKKWILDVRIPEGTLYGTLTRSYVVLKITDGPSRKIRIPVQATTYDR